MTVSRPSKDFTGHSVLACHDHRIFEAVNHREIVFLGDFVDLFPPGGVMTLPSREGTRISAAMEDVWSSSLSVRAIFPQRLPSCRQCLQLLDEIVIKLTGRA